MFGFLKTGFTLLNFSLYMLECITPQLNLVLISIDTAYLKYHILLYGKQPLHHTSFFVVFYNRSQDTITTCTKTLTWHTEKKTGHSLLNIILIHETVPISWCILSWMSGNLMRYNRLHCKPAMMVSNPFGNHTQHNNNNNNNNNEYGKSITFIIVIDLIVTTSITNHHFQCV